MWPPAVPADHPLSGRCSACWSITSYLAVWNELPGRVGMANAQQFWDHVAMMPGQPPKVGTSSVMKDKHNAPKWPGYSKRRVDGLSR
jgi:hypothetical protein